jgi:hypothetical protein
MAQPRASERIHLPSVLGTPSKEHFPTQPTSGLRPQRLWRPSYSSAGRVIDEAMMRVSTHSFPHRQNSESEDVEDALTRLRHEVICDWCLRGSLPLPVS